MLSISEGMHSEQLDFMHDCRADVNASRQYLKVGMAFKGLPILLVIAIGVPHGMGILALDQGARL